MQHKVLPPCSPHRVGTRIREGCLFFEKRHPSLTPSQRKFFIASEQLEELQCLPIAPLACGKAAFTPAIRLGVLLSSAAALPISRWYSLISVYRSTHQCGERSNAAFRRQSAANLTSHAPHDSKARLQNGDETHGFMAKPCRVSPFSALPHGAGNPPTASGRHNFQALCASKPFKDFFSSRRNTITLRRNGKKYVATR